jgi:hypothetical protein
MPAITLPKKAFILKFLGIFCLLVGVFYLRFFGLDWDQGQHLHPDERFLVMVADGLAWPDSLAEYFNTQQSKLNPHNRGFDFYVYGTWPVVLTKFVAEKLSVANYAGFSAVGRGLSATADFTTFILVILITAKIIGSQHRYIGALAAGLTYGLIITSIQQAHFFTTDSFLVLSLTAAFYAALHKPGIGSSLSIGLLFGLAVATKVSACLFGPILGLLLIIKWFKLGVPISKMVFFVALIGVMFGLSLRTAYPMLFQSEGFLPTGLNQLVLKNWESLKSFEGMDSQFPPALQWIPTIGTTYLFKQFIVWGIGLPITVLLAILLATNQREKKPIELNSEIIIAMIWMIGLLLYQSTQFAKTLRYLYPIIPFVAIIIGVYLQNFHFFAVWKKSLVIGLFVAAAWWLSCFLTVYQRPHTRVAASNWLYATAPTGSAITFEYWDDSLPLAIGSDNPLSHEFEAIQLGVADSDNLQKWNLLSSKLADANYIVLSSNRFWRSISALSEKYPLTANYYRKLFDGTLGFTAVAQFSNYPCLITGDTSQNQLILPNLHPKILELTQTSYCQLALSSEGAEEAVTVYDHPTVLVFQNTANYSADEIFNLVRNLAN